MNFKNPRLFSLFVMVLGSLSTWLLTFLMKEKLSANDFGVYSMCFSLATVYSIVGFLGGESILFRNGKVDDGVIILNRRSYIFFNLLSALSLFVAFASAHITIGLDLNNLFIIIVSYIVMRSAFMVRLYYGNLPFQIILNAWKPFFLGLVSAAFFYYGIKLEGVIHLLLVSYIFTLLFCIHISKSYKVCLVNGGGGGGGGGEDVLAFFLSAIISLIFVFLDRVYVTYFYGLEEFGVYFYYLTMVVMPFRFVASFISGELLLKYKNSGPDSFFKDVFFSLVVGVFGAILVYSISCYFPFLNLDDHSYLIPALLLGVVKVVYAVFSCAITVKADGNRLLKANIVYISLSISFVVLFSFLFMSANSGFLFLLIGFLYLLRIVQYQFKVLSWQ